MNAIDKSKGVTIRQHSSGMRVYMYKKEPGVFLDVNGQEVAPEIAAQCGFNVEALMKAKRKAEALEAAKARIEAEFEDASADVDAIAEASTELEVKHVGFGKYAVFDADGKQITRRSMTKDEANALAKGVAKPAEGDGDEGDGDEGDKPEKADEPEKETKGE